ncbi:hypothetical protein ARMSODRAFT_980030 [Armillaria solidipes]|uniref:Uncharacterized protein n=1 Tax=Armillaria solidipes TaxID=1076256 RepID=A0A2H3BJY6_9AGAR|nr:hypothetical protein ARMSODRAFT_980030 [Armillaria solidipes]
MYSAAGHPTLPKCLSLTTERQWILAYTHTSFTSTDNSSRSEKVPFHPTLWSPPSPTPKLYCITTSSWRTRSAGWASSLMKRPSYGRKIDCIGTAMIDWIKKGVETSMTILAPPRLREEPVGNGELVRKARYGPAMLDMAFSDDPDACETLSKLHEFTKWQLQKEQARYKYLFYVDGNAWSGRSNSLLPSHALIFKSTIYPERQQGNTVARKSNHGTKPTTMHGPRLQPFLFLNGNSDARVDDDIFITYANVPSPTLNTDPVRDTELEGSGLPDNQNLKPSYGTDNSSMKTATASEKDISVKDPGVRQPLTPVPVTAGARSDSVALLLQPSTPMVVDVSPPSPPMNIPERPRPLNVTDDPSYLFGCVLPVTLSGWLEVGGDIALQTLAIEALQLTLMRRFDKLGGLDSVQLLLYEIFRRISENTKAGNYSLGGLIGHGERLRASRFLEMGRHLKRGGERDHKFGSVHLGRSISTRFGRIEVVAGAI